MFTQKYYPIPSYQVTIVSWYEVRVFPLFLFCLLIVILYNPCTNGCVGRLGHMQALLIDLLMSIYTLGL
jgi:hypothetical protein